MLMIRMGTYVCLQEPDLLLLDEPTNHLDLDTIEWLEDYLNQQDVPMVIISHDRAFLDQLCTKIVETDMGVSRTFEGNYSQYVISKAAWIEAQYAAWEKQQKEIEHTRDLISRLGAGANSGRASSAEKVYVKNIFSHKFKGLFMNGFISNMSFMLELFELEVYKSTIACAEIQFLFRRIRLEGSSS